MQDRINQNAENLGILTERMSNIIDSLSEVKQNVRDIKRSLDTKYVLRAEFDDYKHEIIEMKTRMLNEISKKLNASEFAPFQSAWRRMLGNIVDLLFKAVFIAFLGSEIINK